MENEKINHKIIIDELVSIDIKLPKVMSYMEFNGLFLKYKKILSITGGTEFNTAPIINNTKPTKINKKYLTTNEMNDKIKELYLSGLSVKQISKKVGIAPKTIYKRVQIRTFSLEPRAGKKIWTDEIGDKIANFVYDYAKNDYSKFDIKVIRKYVKYDNRFNETQIRNFRSNYKHIIMKKLNAINGKKNREIEQEKENEKENAEINYKNIFDF